MRLRFALAEVGQGLRRNSSMALAVVIVTFVSLAFVGAAALLQVQVDKLKDEWFDKVEVSIFLCPENADKAHCKGLATQAQEDAIEEVLTTGALGELVETVYYETREEAYERAKENDPDGIYLRHLTAENMQASFRVKLKDPEQFTVVSSAVQNLDGVYEVVDQREIFKNLFAVLNRATLLTAAVAGSMLLAAMLLITTTIRLSALSRRRETTIMRMVGSSKTLIQLPFMLEGAIAATLGALLSIGGLVLGVRYLVEDWLSSSVQFVDYVDTSDVLSFAPWLLVIAFALSAVASLVTIGRYTSA